MKPCRPGWRWRKILLIFLSLMLAAALAVPTQAASTQDYDSLRLLTEAFYEISQKYVAKKGEEEMIYGSLRGMVNSLDPDSSFLTPEEYQGFLNGQKGPVAEAGLELIIKDHLLTVVSALEGGPAYRAGLRPGDYILKIDGKIVRNLSTQEAVRRFQGKPGTSLKLQALRNGLVKPLDLTVTLESLLADNLFYPEVKEAVAIYRSEHDGGISTTTGAGNGDDIFVATHQPGIGSHHRYLADYLHPLTKNPQDISDYISNSIGSGSVV